MAGKGNREAKHFYSLNHPAPRPQKQGIFLNLVAIFSSCVNKI